MSVKARNTNQKASPIWVALRRIGLTSLAVTVIGSQAQAQFTGNNQTNIISGVTSNWTGDYYVGSNFVFDALFIQNGGVLTNSGNGYIGQQSGGKSNAVVVAGSGSAWKGGSSTELYVGNSDGKWSSLIITNGGIVTCSLGFVGGAKNPGSSWSNVVVVTDPGSTWTCSTELSVGDVGGSNTLIISDGGKVSSAAGYLGNRAFGGDNLVQVTGLGAVWSNSFFLFVGRDAGNNRLVISNGGNMIETGPGSIIGLNSSNNSVLVTGNGSIWNTYNELDVGESGSSNTLTISNGGSVFAISTYVGVSPGSVGNRIDVSDGGTLDAIMVLDVRGGTLSLSGGTVFTANLSLTNGSSSVIAFNRGTLDSEKTAVTNTQQFVVGDGVNVATFHVGNSPDPSSGIHSFANGLRVRANSFLTGCGTINGVVVVDAGGSVAANCGGALTFTSSVTNNGIMHAENGSVLESYGPVVNNGLIDIMDGTTNFHSTFVNNGTIVGASYFRVVGLTKQGNDVKIAWTAVGGRRYVAQASMGDSNGGYTNNFTDLILPFTVPGTSLSATNYLDVGGATNAPSRFYRVRLVP